MNRALKRIQLRLRGKQRSPFKGLFAQVVEDEQARLRRVPKGPLRRICKALIDKSKLRKLTRVVYGDRQLWTGGGALTPETLEEASKLMLNQPIRPVQTYMSPDAIKRLKEQFNKSISKSNSNWRTPIFIEDEADLVLLKPPKVYKKNPRRTPRFTEAR